MSRAAFDDISKDVHAAIPELAPSLAPLPIPAFSDISKPSNDLISKDFYHTAAANLEVKLKTPNGANLSVKGKQAFDGATTASVEGKYALKPQGKLHQPRSTSIFLTSALSSNPVASGSPRRLGITGQLVDQCAKSRVTVTQGWTTAALLDTKIELDNIASQPVKATFQNLWNPNKPSAAVQKLNFTFKQPNMHARAFLDHAVSGNINAVIDAVVGHQGFLVGAEAGYDVQKAAVTRYTGALGYHTDSFTASLVGQQNFSVVAASFYQKVSSTVEAGAKATYDIRGGSEVGLELASKYKLDTVSFAKVKINNRGIAALAYNTKLNAGTTLGLGLSLDTNKLNEAGHKIGTSLTFEG